MYKYFIYKHIRLDNNQVFYIGKGKIKTKGNPFKRSKVTQRNTYWKNIVRSTPYRIEIIRLFKSEVEALRYENYLILKYKSKYETANLKTYDDPNEKYVEKIRNNVPKIKIHKYDLEGNYLESFESLREASNICECDVYNTTTNRNITAGGFQWSKKLVNKMPSLKTRVRKLRPNKYKKINQYTVDNKFIKTWDSYKEIENILGYKRTGIANRVNSNKISHGFKWYYTKN